MDYFKYGEKEIKYLQSVDNVLGEKIKEIGFIKREVTLNPFIALIKSVVSQQISSKSATTVYNKLEKLLGDVCDKNIEKSEIEDIQKCGMSYRKAEYIKGIAHESINKTIDFENLNSMSDEEIVKKLSKLRGIGVWTVEMLLIFSLNRLNVLSYDDLAIKRGIMRLYKLETLNKRDFLVYKDRYSPYSSVASLYLWYISS